MSGIGGMPLKPLLPPPRVSGAVGVRTSTLLLGAPSPARPLAVSPEPLAAGELDSLRRSQALSPALTTSNKTPVQASAKNFGAGRIGVK